MKNIDIKNLKDKEPFGQELMENVVSNLNLPNVDMDSVEKIILSIFKNSTPDRAFQNMDFEDINLKSDSSTSAAKENQPSRKKEQIFSFTKIPKEKKKELELMKKNSIQQQNTTHVNKNSMAKTNNINANYNNTIQNLNNYYNNFQYKPTTYLNGSQKMTNGYGSYLQNYYNNYNYLNEYSDPNGYNKNAQIEHFINSCLDSSNPEDLTKLLMFFSGDTMNSTFNTTMNSNLYQNPYFFQQHQQQNKEKEMYNTLKRYVSESYSNHNKTVNSNSTAVNNANNLSSDIKDNNNIKNEEKEKNNKKTSQEAKEETPLIKPDGKINNQKENNDIHQNQQPQIQNNITSNNNSNSNTVNSANNYIVNLINDSSPQKQKQVDYAFQPQQTQIPNNLYPPFYNFANYQNYAQLAKNPLYSQFMMNPTQNSTLYQVYNNNNNN